jgi:hypothetical protein
VTKHEYMALHIGLEPPDFVDWFERWYGKPSELAEVELYWQERQSALNGWWAHEHRGLPWPQVLEKVGYGHRAREFNRLEGIAK